VTTEYGLSLVELDVPIEVMGADGLPLNGSPVQCKTRPIMCKFGQKQYRWSVMDLPEDAILGMDWLMEMQACVNFGKGKVLLEDREEREPRMLKNTQSP
jgi:hypothetical protein